MSKFGPYVIRWIKLGHKWRYATADSLLFIFSFQTYLARTESSSSGSITWQVDLRSCDLVIDSVTIVATSATFQTGQVEWKLSGDDESQSEILSGGQVFNDDKNETLIFVDLCYNILFFRPRICRF